MTVREVLEAVCRYFGVPFKHLMVRKPNLRTIYIRTVAVYMVRQVTTATFREIADELGNLGRPGKLGITTLIQSMKRIVDGDYREAGDDIRALTDILRPTRTRPA